MWAGLSIVSKRKMFSSPLSSGVKTQSFSLQPVTLLTMLSWPSEIVVTSAVVISVDCFTFEQSTCSTHD
jgi:hypothetical protein